MLYNWVEWLKEQELLWPCPKGPGEGGAAADGEEVPQGRGVEGANPSRRQKVRAAACTRQGTLDVKRCHAADLLCWHGGMQDVTMPLVRSWHPVVRSVRPTASGSSARRRTRGQYDGRHALVPTLLPWVRCRSLLPRTACCRTQEPSGAVREAEAWELLRSLRVTSGEPTVEKKSTFQVGARTWPAYRGSSRIRQLAAPRVLRSVSIGLDRLVGHLACNLLIGHKDMRVLPHPLCRTEVLYVTALLARVTHQAHVAPVSSFEEVAAIMDALLSISKIRAATHNIMAYRIEHGGAGAGAGSGAAGKSSFLQVGARGFACGGGAVRLGPSAVSGHGAERAVLTLLTRVLPALLMVCARTNTTTAKEGTRPLVTQLSPFTLSMCAAHAVISHVPGQDYDDDGETAAGGRLLHLLQAADVRNVVVVVSRWFGGVLMGPQRFTAINNCARALLEQMGLVGGGGGAGGGKGEGAHGGKGQGAGGRKGGR